MNPDQATTAGAVVAVCAIILMILKRWFAARDERARREAAQRAAYQSAEDEWRAAAAAHDPARLALARERLDKLRRRGWHLLALALAAAALPGCARPAAALVPVGEYILFPKPGEAAPELPQGETGWLLLSIPRGAEMALPESSPVLDGLTIEGASHD